ncbi:unnamed protein product [Owenia fusiformis]|uniref:Uncharacterized protein n=1 Tax=Owenia fusiformis TaxID=6347 RepID=A0A8J1TUZ6_OWEFU|nr:unnamed protein product [Owenia fusiformis]
MCYNVTICKVYSQVNIFRKEFCRLQCGNQRHGIFPDPTGSCCHYVTCHGNGFGFFVGERQACMEPLVWNPVAGACDYASDVPGCDSSCHEFIDVAPLPTAGTLLTDQCFKNGRTYTFDDSVDSGGTCYYVDNEIMKNCCPFGQMFDLEECACLGEMIAERPNCECVAWFTFDTNFEDSLFDIFSGRKRATIDENEGQFGGSAVFSGEGHMFIPYFNNFYFGERISVALWFRTSTTTVQGLLTNGCCNQPPTVEIRCDSGSVTITLDVMAGAKSITFSGASPDSWQHVAFTYDGQSFTAYHNGNVVETLPLRGPILTNKCDVTIGRGRDDPPGSFLEGAVDEFVVCQSVWSESDILGIFQSNDVPTVDN